MQFAGAVLHDAHPHGVPILSANAKSTLLTRASGTRWFRLARFRTVGCGIPGGRLSKSPEQGHGLRRWSRDGALYSPDEDPEVVIQCSVQVDWKGKIKATIERLAETHPDARRLIYATNQHIGARGDALVAELRASAKVHVDIRDASWFIERELTHPQREAAAEELALRIVEPLLRRKRVTDAVAQPLSDEDARIALLHLALEENDWTSEKGLTKASFDALVGAALHDTDPDNRISAEEITTRVRAMLPAAEVSVVQQQVRTAIERMTARGGAVKHHKASDDYCLAYESRLEVEGRTSQFLLDAKHLEEYLANQVTVALPGIDPDQAIKLGIALRTVTESAILKQGEGFVHAVVTGAVTQLDHAEIASSIAAMADVDLKPLTIDIASSLVLDVLGQPSDGIQRHLRRLANAYTLYAFLLQTPDVQKVIVKVFSRGDIWLDSSVVLPLLAETLLPDPRSGHYTKLFRAAKDAGLGLHVTLGVVEEVESHINRSLTCARTAPSDWNSEPPFLFKAFTLAGRPRGEFATWAEEFRGSVQPQQDVCDYLADEYGIDVRDLHDAAQTADIRLRGVVQELWNERNEKRRKLRGQDADVATLTRLAEHDVDNCVGVMVLRKGSESSPMGYQQWFLTLDRTAFRLRDRLRAEYGQAAAPASPALSPDFLTQLLRLGPLRSVIERELHVDLPLVTDISQVMEMPKALIEIADQLRDRHAELSPRIRQRRIRDELNEVRMRLGAEAEGGAQAAEERLMERLENDG